MTGIQGEIQVRRDTSANWVSANPVLGLAEPAFDTTIKRFKSGDGVTAWNNLGWATDTPFIPPPSTGWTTTTLGTATIAADGIDRVCTAPSAAGDNLRMEYRTLSPAISYTFTICLEYTPINVNYNTGYIALRNSGSGSVIIFGTGWDSNVSGTGLTMSATKYTSATAFSAHYLQRGLPGFVPWLRFRDDATTRFFEYSFNGLDWQSHHSVGRTDFITPDQVGWGCNSNATGGSYTAYGRLRSWTVT